MGLISIVFLLYLQFVNKRKTLVPLDHALATTLLGIFYVYASIEMDYADTRLILNTISNANNEEILMEMTTICMFKKTFLQQAILGYSFLHQVASFVNCVYKQCKGICGLFNKLVWLVPLIFLMCLYLESTQEYKSKFSHLFLMPSVNNSEENQINLTLNKIYSIMNKFKVETYIEDENLHNVTTWECADKNITTITKIWVFFLCNVCYFILLFFSIYCFIKSEHCSEKQRKMKLSTIGAFLWLPTIVEVMTRTFITNEPPGLVEEILLSLSSISHLLQNVIDLPTENIIGHTISPAIYAAYGRKVAGIGDGYTDEKVIAMWDEALRQCSKVLLEKCINYTKNLIKNWYEREKVLDVSVNEFIIRVDQENDSSSDSSDTY
ncbi:hypothetical protein FQA39_LY15762 [Lamprigera yunnana]|nr:hypothetical protein FQA39_LY15762 [Lamprigera yunnana]